MRNEVFVYLEIYLVYLEIYDYVVSSTGSGFQMYASWRGKNLLNGGHGH
jgi:hypothetical protein